MTQKIPLIDFGHFSRGPEPTRRAVADEVFKTLHQFGFLVLANHNVARPVVERAFVQAKLLFGLSAEKKNKLRWRAGGNNGYSDSRGEQLDPAGREDRKEVYNVGLEGDADSADPVRWPSEVPGFRKETLALWSACFEFCGQVLQAVALAMGLPENFFEPLHHTGADNSLRFLSYAPASLNVGTVRAGAHTDYGSLTLLFQDDKGGLQIENTGSEWLDIPCIPDTVIVNTGDLMERWTNGTLRSTKHRVVDRGFAEPRHSIAYFCHPDPNVCVTPLPTCCSTERPAKYEPILARQYLIDQFSRTHSQ